MAMAPPWNSAIIISLITGESMIRGNVGISNSGNEQNIIGNRAKAGLDIQSKILIPLNKKDAVATRLQSQTRLLLKKEVKDSSSSPVIPTANEKAPAARLI